MSDHDPRGKLLELRATTRIVAPARRLHPGTHHDPWRPPEWTPFRSRCDVNGAVSGATVTIGDCILPLPVACVITEPLLTCQAVLAETAFHLDSAAVALAMINEGLVALAFDCRDHLVQLERLADRYADQKPDLADLCLVRMSELFPKHSVITIDRTDFQVFRRNKREAIPILCPPERRMVTTKEI
jgi:hypothetical protein